MIINSNIYQIKPPKAPAIAITFAKAGEQEFSNKNWDSGLSNYINEVISISFLDPGKEMELGKKINAGREAEKILIRIEAIKTLEKLEKLVAKYNARPEEDKKIKDQYVLKIKILNKLKTSKNKEAVNTAIQYVQGKEIEQILKKVIPDKMNEVMEMVREDKTNEIIGEKLLELGNHKFYSSFIKQPGLQDEKIIQKIMEAKKETHDGSNNYKSVVAEIINRLKKGVKAEKTIDNSKKYNDNDLDEFKKAAEEGKIAQEELILPNLRIVRPIVSNYRFKLGYNDAIQIGNLGLIKAAKEFDYEKDFKFYTFAKKCIINSIKEAINNTNVDLDRIARLPWTVRRDISNLKTAEIELSRELGRKATPKEIEGKYKIPIKKQDELRRIDTETFTSISTPITEDGDETVGDCIADKTRLSSGDAIIEKDFKKKTYKFLSEVMEDLSEQEKYILKKRYGIDEPQEEGHSQEEIGKELGMRKAGVSISEIRALRKIRQKIELAGKNSDKDKNRLIAELGRIFKKKYSYD